MKEKPIVVPEAGLDVAYRDSYHDLSMDAVKSILETFLRWQKEHYTVTPKRKVSN